MKKDFIEFDNAAQLADVYQKLEKNGMGNRKRLENLDGFTSIVDKLEECASMEVENETHPVGKEALSRLLKGPNGSNVVLMLKYKPLLAALINEEGTIKIGDEIYDVMSEDGFGRFCELLPQAAGGLQILDPGYKFTEEPPEELVQNFPVNDLFPFTFPGYPTKLFYDKIDGRKIIIQAWKGTAGSSTSRHIPGGVGAEVGIYQGHKPTFLERLMRSLIKAFWPPDYGHKWNLEFTLYNEKDEIFFSAAHEGIWWLHRWMKNDSYRDYRRINNLTRDPDKYRMEFKVQGNLYHW